MSVTVRRMNAEERDYYSAMLVRATSVQAGAPFLQSALFALDPFILDAPIGTPNVPMMAVDEQCRVYLHMERIRKAGIDFAGAGLIHECNHPFRNHFARFRNVPEQDRDLVNQAEDAEINDDISNVMRDSSGKLVDRPRTDTTPRSKTIMKAYYPEIEFRPVFPASYDLPDNQTAEEYLYELKLQRDKQKKEQKQEDSSSQSGQGGGQGAGSPGEESGEGDGAQEADEAQERHDAGVCGGGSGTGGKKYDWELGAKTTEPGALSTSGKTHEEQNIVRAKVAGEILDYQKSHGIGSVPAGLAKAAAEYLDEPQVSWRQETRRVALRTFQRKRAGNSQINRSKRDRRHVEVTKVIYPGWTSYYTEVGVALDTSSSMQNGDTVTALTELDSMMRTLGVRNNGVHFFSVDAKTYQSQKIHDISEIKMKGGGGTDMMKCFPVFDKMKIDLAIIMTDGDVIWDVTYQPSKKHTTIVLVISKDFSLADPSRFPKGVIPIHVQPSAL